MIFTKLFFIFLKIGAFTFGGGYAMLPFVEQEVLKNGWMTLEELVDFIAVSESTPGPFAVNVATYVGTHTAGLSGAFFATFGVVLPSFIIILIIAQAYEKFRDSAVVMAVMTGLRPAVVGLIAASVVTVAISVFFGSNGTVITNMQRIISVILFVVSTYLIIKKKTHPIKIIVMAAIVGIAAGYAGLI